MRHCRTWRKLLSYMRAEWVRLYLHLLLMFWIPIDRGSRSMQCCWRQWVRIRRNWWGRYWRCKSWLARTWSRSQISTWRRLMLIWWDEVNWTWSTWKQGSISSVCLIQDSLMASKRIEMRQMMASGTKLLLVSETISQHLKIHPTWISSESKSILLSIWLRSSSRWGRWANHLLQVDHLPNRTSNWITTTVPKWWRIEQNFSSPSKMQASQAT